MDNQLPPGPPPQQHATTTAHGCATSGDRPVQNLKSLLLKCVIASAPPQSLSLEHKAFLEKRIQDLSLPIHTPNHPPYAWMIENAIRGLNEGVGSDEEAISKFILEEYKDLPWAHAAFLKHHLNRLCEDGTLYVSQDGCYLVSGAGVTHGLGIRVTCTTDRSRSPSPDLSRPNPTGISSHAFSDTSSSSDSFDPRRERKEMNCKRRKRRRRQKQNSGGVRMHPKCKRGQGLDRASGQGRGGGRGRGRGRGRGNPCLEDMMGEECIGQDADDACMHDMQMVEIHCLISEDEAADYQVEDDICMDSMKMVDIHCLISEDEESVQGANLPREITNQNRVVLENQDTLEHECRIDGAMIEPLQQKNNADSCSTPSAITQSQRRKLTSEQGSKKVGQRERSINSRRKPQTGTERGRSRKRETVNNMNLLKTTEIGGEQNLPKEDQCYQQRSKAYLINNEDTANMVEVEIHFVDEVEHCMVEAANENLRRKEIHQVEMTEEEVNVDHPKELLSEQPLEIDAEHDQPIYKRLGTENTQAGEKGKELSRPLKQIKLLEPQHPFSESQPTETEEKFEFPRQEKSSGTNQGRLLKPISSRNESPKAADRFESSINWPEFRRKKEVRTFRRSSSF